MTQEDVFNVLKKEQKWMTTKEIASKLDISPGSVCQNLNQLLKYGEVLMKIQPKCHVWSKPRPYVWKIK